VRQQQRCLSRLSNLGMTHDFGSLTKKFRALRKLYWELHPKAPTSEGVLFWCLGVLAAEGLPTSVKMFELPRSSLFLPSR
jgi:hypothetical protein